ncbi:hypothetical protein E4U52_002224 [Claviceps spartinae]|nr:hypothetical protein E4U52_002224 [Claviceps spartinae]
METARCTQPNRPHIRPILLLGRIALSGTQFKRHDAVATVAFKPRYMPPSLDLQTGQRVHKAIRTLRSTTTGDLACPVSTDYYASH